jgi:hypothetical protein
VKTSKKSLALMMTSAFAASVLSTTVAASENPFSIKPLASGYMLADASDSGKKQDDHAASAQLKEPSKAKAKEGACSAEKMKDGACSAEMRNASKEAKQGTGHDDKK